MNSFRRRAVILCILIVLFLAVYAVGRQFSPAIVAYVVEEALVQKAPQGVSALEAHRHFQEWLAGIGPDRRLNELLDLSRYLEKVQKLTPDEFIQLLRRDPRAGHSPSASLESRDIAATN
jgi:hypothetical protein